MASLLRDIWRWAAAGEPPEDVGGPRPSLTTHPRSPHWPKARAEHLRLHLACEVCGRTRGVEVHHVLPYHLHPDLELRPDNLMTLCEGAGGGHHLLFGHLMRWMSYNPDCRKDVALWKQKIADRP